MSQRKRERENQEISELANKRLTVARHAGWTQKELAGKINEKPTVVSAYESDTKCVPNTAILMKFEKVLDVKLRGDLS